MLKTSDAVEQRTGDAIQVSLDFAWWTARLPRHLAVRRARRCLVVNGFWACHAHTICPLTTAASSSPRNRPPSAGSSESGGCSWKSSNPKPLAD